MAKNNYLFGFFLCLIAGLCIGIGGVVVESFEQSKSSCPLGSEIDLGIRHEDLGNGEIGGSRYEAFMTEGVDLRNFVGHMRGRISSVLMDSLSVSLESDRKKRWLTERLDELNEDIIRNKIKQIYTAEIGVREKTGKNDGKRVEEYLAVTHLGKGYAWCAAFVSWVFSEAGFPEPRTPWSPALFPKKRVIWERGKNLKPNTRNLIPQPATADVFGIYFANLKRIAHVGFVDEWGEKQVITVEGNTNEAGSGEGDGVYRKRRPIASIYQVANWVDLEVEP